MPGCEPASGGEKRRVALCKLLLSQPDMLLLDEPTNHLDAESVAWLERFLGEYPGTVVAVTHDRYFLDNVAGWILELDRGRGIPFEGNYSAWLDAKDKRLSSEEQEQARQRPSSPNSNGCGRPKGRQAKSKARLARFEELMSKEVQARNETSRVVHPARTAAGRKGHRAERRQQGLRRPAADRRPHLQHSARRHRRHHRRERRRKNHAVPHDHGREQPDKGKLSIGETVQLAYVDQSRDDLDNSKNVWEELSNGQDIMRIGQYEINSRTYVGRFNFRGADQQKKVGDLSGGERNRLHLAKLLRQGANVLLLDEPTNDLDVETLRALEDALLNFPGSW